MDVGIPEREFNEIRKALSDVKEGGLLRNFNGNRLTNIFLSDEREHRLDAISSGPTIMEHPMAAMNVLEKYNLKEILEREVVEVISHRSKCSIDQVKVQKFCVWKSKKFCQSCDANLLI